MKKKELSMLLSAVLILSLLTLLPMLVLSTDASTTQVGDLTVTGGTLDTDFSYANNTLTVNTSTPLIISGTTTTDKIVTAPNITAYVTLKDLSIEVSTCAFDVQGIAYITLEGTNTLKSNDQYAGLQVENGYNGLAECYINGDGELLAQGCGWGSGIGSSRGYMCAKITINSGKITAIGGDRMAGIGSRCNSNTIITINGGEINATGGARGAGIGGMSSAPSGHIIINGGKVTATGGQWAAGIGSGQFGSRNGGSIVINGGFVTANGGTESAGIGAGWMDNGTTTFSTGENGGAVIVTDSISDQSNASSWSGIFFVGESSTLYGTDVTLNADTEIPADKQVTIAEGQTLTIGKDATLKNYGTIINNGTFILEGEFSPEGTIEHNGAYIDNTKFNQDGLLITGGRYGKDFTYADSLITVLTDTPLTISNTATDHRILVPAGVDANITLNGFCSSPNTLVSPFEVLGSANITLVGENRLIACEPSNKAGLSVGGNAGVTIGGTGSLTAQGGVNAAGIGASSMQLCGTITITSGTITATGGGGAAGIGGSLKLYGPSFVPNGGTVIINGGVVRAIGKGSAYGIGCGTGGTSGTFIMGENSNAVVIATSIEDNDDTSAWSGLVLAGKDGRLYTDSFSLYADIEIPEGYTLTIDEGRELLIDEGVTLTNNGTLNNSGVVHVNGTLQNTGTITNAAATGLIQNDGVMTNSGTIINHHNLINNDTMTNDGAIINHDTVSNNGSFTMSSSGTLDNYNDLANGPDGTFISYGTITNSNHITNRNVFLSQGTLTHTETGTWLNIAEDDIYAEGGTTYVGYFAIDGGMYGVDFAYADHTLTIQSSTPVIIRPKTPGQSTSTDKLVVAENAEAYVTLDDIYILYNDGWTNICAFEVRGTAYITLEGHNRLSSGTECAGLQVQAGAAVIIDGTGVLTATGGAMGAGIGGGYHKGGGAVTIAGGSIIAQGGNNGAGIGNRNMNGTNNGTITITGGYVKATGGANGGAGIGGSYGTSGGRITISGGDVTAIGGGNGAGIGGGRGANGGTITITGGQLMIDAGSNAAGIGGGYRGWGGNITISGGVLDVVNGDIGRGVDGTNSGTFTTGENGQAWISGGVVIDDKSHQSEWSGIIIEGYGETAGEGRIYGDSFTLTGNAKIYGGTTLTIAEGQTLIIADGASLLHYGILDNYGTIINEGVFNNGDLHQSTVLGNYATVNNYGTIDNDCEIYNYGIIDNSNGTILNGDLVLNMERRNGERGVYNGRIPTVDFKSISISVGTDIRVNYHITTYNDALPQVRFTVNGYTTLVDCVTDTTGRYVAVFEGVAPQWIGDTIKAELLLNGEVIETKEYTVLTYLNRLKQKTPADLGYSQTKYDAMITLVNDLLIYAGAAQTYTGHNTDSLVSDGITGTTYVPLTDTDAATKKGTYVQFTGATLYFDSVNKLVFKFTAADLEGVTLKLSIGGAPELDLTYTANGDGTYTILTEAIYATGFDDVYTVIAYKDGEVDAKLRYSVKSYVASMQNKEGPIAELVKATYNYGLAAEAFARIYE